MRRLAHAALTALGVLLLADCRDADHMPAANASSASGTADSRSASAAPIAPFPSETASAEPTAAATPAPIAATAVSGGGARSVSESNDLYEFSYAYPAAAGAIPALRTLLDAGLAKAKAALISESKADRAEAKKNGYPYHAHSSGTDWKVVSDLPGWLSLSSQLYVFTGGAHGMTNFDALLWDKSAGVRRQALDLFVGKAALRGAVKAPFCAALDRERAKKRGGDYSPGPDDPFGKCIDPVDETTVILGSRGGARFDRIGFLIAPYSAGPYAEGTYEVTLPLSPALLRAIKPEFRDAFAQP